MNKRMRVNINQVTSAGNVMLSDATKPKLPCLYHLNSLTPTLYNLGKSMRFPFLYIAPSSSTSYCRNGYNHSTPDTEYASPTR